MSELPASALVGVAIGASLVVGAVAAAYVRVSERLAASLTAFVGGILLAAGLIVDGIPESLALGLTIVDGGVGLSLLLGIIVGNTVEAYGAAHPILVGGHSSRFAIGLLTGIGVALAAATIVGGTVLVGADPALVGAGQALAAGAILAVISISIIPYAFGR